MSSPVGTAQSPYQTSLQFLTLLITLSLKKNKQDLLTSTSPHLLVVPYVHPSVCVWVPFPLVTCSLLVFPTAVLNSLPLSCASFSLSDFMWVTSLLVGKKKLTQTILRWLRFHLRLHQLRWEHLSDSEAASRIKKSVFSLGHVLTFFVSLFVIFFSCVHSILLPPNILCFRIISIPFLPRLQMVSACHVPIFNNLSVLTPIVNWPGVSVVLSSKFWDRDSK